MKRLIAVAVVGIAACSGADAQHGGGGHAGGGGGFHGGGGGFVSHGGGGGRVGGAVGGFSRPVNRGGGGSYAPRNGGQGQFRGFGTGQGVGSGRPGFYHRGGDRRREIGSRYGGGLGYGDYGYLDANDPDVDTGYGGGYDSGTADNGGYDAGPVQDGAGGSADGYDGYPAQGSGDAGREDGGGEPPVPYVAGAAGGGSAGSGVRRPVVSQASLYNGDAVTLVFKDGRAQEKIHNYVLTRTTLYVTDGRRREIPVASLDLVATEKANLEAGVHFQLPSTP